MHSTIIVFFFKATDRSNHFRDCLCAIMKHVDVSWEQIFKCSLALHLFVSGGGVKNTVKFSDKNLNILELNFMLNRTCFHLALPPKSHQHQNSSLHALQGQ